MAKGTTSVVNLATFSASAFSGAPDSLVVDDNGNIYGTAAGGGVNGMGSVWALPAGSHTMQTLASYDTSTTGFGPNGVLLSGGFLYCTAEEGGQNGDGTIFKVPVGGGDPTDVTPFDETNGSFPNDGLIEYNGTIYGTTSGGGMSGNGVVFSWPSNGGPISRLASFGGDAGTAANGNLVVSNGALFGTAFFEPGLCGNGESFELPISGGTILAVPFTGTEGSTPIDGLYVVGSTTVGVAVAGGAHYGTIFSVNPSNFAPTVKYTFQSSDAGPYRVLGTDAAGNLYFLGDQNDSTPIQVGVVVKVDFSGSGTVPPSSGGPQTLTWTGGGDNETWSNPANWDKNASPIDGDSLVFPANHAATTQNDLSDLALASITIDGDYTLAGNTIGVGSAITVKSGTSVLAMPTVLALGGTELDVNGGSLEVASALSGPGSVQVTGPSATLEPPWQRDHHGNDHVAGHPDFHGEDREWG